MEERGEDLLDKIFTALYLQEHLGVYGFWVFVFFFIIRVQGFITGGKYVTENKERVCLFRGIMLCLYALLSAPPERVRVLHCGRFTECTRVRMRPHPGAVLFH